MDTVAVVVPYEFIPPTNGGQRVCHNFCLALSKRINTVCITAGRSDKSTDLKVLQILGGSCLKYINPLLTIRLIRTFRRLAVRVCIINHPYFFLIGYLVCKLTNTKLITYSHNLEYVRRDRFSNITAHLVAYLEYFTYRKSDSVFFISNSELEEAVEKFQLSRQSCFFVPHIANPSTKVPHFPSEERTPFTIIFFGDFSYSPNRAGLDDLLFNILPALERNSELQCQILVFGKYIPVYHQPVTRGENISVNLVGFVEDLDEQIQLSDVLVNPVSAGAGVQTKIIETLSLGTTVISSDRGLGELILPFVEISSISSGITTGKNMPPLYCR